MGDFMASDKSDVANRLARKFKLNQTPGDDVMKDFGKRIRELNSGGVTVDQAAMKAALEKFPAEFVPTNYNSQGESMEDILADIEKLK